MKQIASLLALALLVTGCASLRVKPRTFDQAVFESIEPQGDHHQVVVVVNKNGSITVAGRPTSLQEVEGLCKVAGLPENPPAALIRGHREARHADVRAVMDAITKSGIWRISFAAIKPKESQNQQVHRTQ
jgi:biopolymer transport protein ExbD